MRMGQNSAAERQGESDWPAASGAEEGLGLRERALRGLPLDGVLVIDDHIHLGPHAGFYQPNSSAAALVRTMDRIGIDQACVFSTLAVVSDMRGGNDLSLAAARAFPDRLLAYAVPDPNQPEQVKDELQRCLDAGARGIKFHTQLHGYPFDGPRYEPAFELADAHRLPLISHGVGSPETLRRVARAYPGAHFIVAHVGAGGAGAPGDALLRVAAEEPNVYLDVASSVARFGAFAEVVRVVGAGKVLYGSDTPWMCFTHQIGRVLLAPISEDDKRRILGQNLATLLKQGPR
ncbi:MAG TPA: amidohydrolase family protein [Chloroflexota bacterium]|nr:amidohydrolase family protein [Chloroflexota bacterium]